MIKLYVFSTHITTALINGTFLTWNFEEEKTNSGFFVQIEWQTVAISFSIGDQWDWWRYKYDTGNIDFQSTFVCSLQLIDDVFLCFKSLFGVQFLTVGVVHAADDALAHEEQFGNDE